MKDNRGMKLLIIDDHPILREGIAAMLRQVEPDTIVLQAHDGAEGLHVAEAHDDLDAVMLDLMMPGMAGMTAIREFGKRRPDLPVIVLSSSEDPDDVRHALAAGALGYVPKSASPQTLVSALRFVLQGNIYVPPFILDQVANFATETAATGTTLAPRLTDRQVEVLRLVCQGYSNKEIGRLLGLSDKTVKTHITAIFKALNVSNRTQAASVARAGELI
jgi:two-component system, NarL family, nitrate/nitrite response regulator NarL